jgi:hypothetical protein
LLILPLIDFLILAGTGTLVTGFLMKAIAITTVYRPSILGFTSIDFVVMSGVCWGFALVLAARSWVRLNEPGLLAVRREEVHARALRQAKALDYGTEASEERAPAQASAGERR